MSNSLRKIYLCGPIMDEHEGTAREWREAAHEGLGRRFVMLDPMRKIASVNKLVQRSVASAERVN